MRRRGTLASGIVLLALGLLATSVPALADTLPPGYRMEAVVTGLDHPSAMALAGDGRIFITERTSGQVRIVQNGALLPDPFATISVANTGDAGLLGIALHPAFPADPGVYVYYTDLTTSQNRIVRYDARGSVGVNPTVILDAIGMGPGGLNNGGALAFGTDGKLYAGIGDLEAPSNVQSMSALNGKVLRLNDDGSTPDDNPNVGLSSPYDLIYASGFCHSGGLGVHDGEGTLYASDRYGPAGSCDETNVVTSGGNYGWDTESCSGSAHDPPLHAITPQIEVSGLASYTGDAYPGFTNDLFVAGSSGGTILRDVLGGTGFDTLTESQGFYDALEADCPTSIVDVAEGNGGWLWALSDDATASKAGLYRVIREDYPAAEDYPRAIGGHHIDLIVEKEGAGLKLVWEDLKQQAWLCTPGDCPGGARSEKYTVWEGTLDSLPTYDHAVAADTNGTPEGASGNLLSHSLLSMPAENAYFLVNAWGANQEGSLGSGAIGPRPGRDAATADQCNAIGRASNTEGLCLEEWPHAYPDQDNNMRTLADFRGKAVLMGFEQFG